MPTDQSSAVTPLPRLDGEPAFDHPWQAQSLAIIDTLIENGTVDNALWSRTLGANLQQAFDRGAADNTETYYEAVLQSLEQVLADCGALGTVELSEKTAAWRDAYLQTPHGKPVELSS